MLINECINVWLIEINNLVNVKNKLCNNNYHLFDLELLSYMCMFCGPGCEIHR